MKRKSVKKICAGLILLGAIFAGGSFSTLTAQDTQDFEFNVISTLKFEMLQLGEGNYLFSQSGSLQLMWTKNEESDSNAPDTITSKVSYSGDIFTKGIEGYDEKQFHGLGLFGKVVCGKNSFLLKIDGRDANPFESYKNFEGLLMYGRQLVKTDTLTLTLGGGLAATDTGIKIKGANIFVVPMPMFYFNYSGEIIATAISVRAGYAFGGKEILSADGEKSKRDYDGGFYAAIQGMYKF